MIFSNEVFYLEVLAQVARNTAPAEADLYAELTGAPYDAQTVAAQLYLDPRPRRIWSFYEASPGPITPVAVGGYVLARPGTWTSWFVHTPDAWERGNQITKLVAACVQSMFSDPTVLRLETCTLATRTKARAWYEQIGLTYESTACKASASGQDIVTYVALRS